MNSSNFGETIYSRVRDAIRTEILSGIIPSGTRLKIAEVCKRFNISHMPVREALQQLQGEGIVIIEPNKGAIVREMNATFIRNIYELRGAIECMLLKLSIPHFTESDIVEIQKLEVEMEKQSGTKNQSKYFELNKRFHIKLYSKADNEEALKLLSLHWELLGGLRLRYGYGKDRVNKINSEHKALVKAIAEHNIETAHELLFQHCKNAQENMINKVKEYSDGKPVK